MLLKSPPMETTLLTLLRELATAWLAFLAGVLALLGTGCNLRCSVWPDPAYISPAPPLPEALEIKRPANQMDMTHTEDVWGRIETTEARSKQTTEQQETPHTTNIEDEDTKTI